MSSTSKIVKKHLEVILGDDAVSDYISYICSIKDEDDLDEFMENILNRNDSKHVSSYNTIKNTLFAKAKQSKGQSSSRATSSYNKSPNEKSKDKQSKKKFQDIGTFKQKKKIKEGRMICNCEGQEHEFMNNCLNCGRIHCIEEGPGPCFFCGQMLGLMGDKEFEQENKSSFKHKANTVYDDDNDFFKVKQDQDLEKKKRGLVVALDFASRRVIESSEEDEKLKLKLLEDCRKHLRNVEVLFKNLQRTSEIKPVVNIYDDMVNLLVKMRYVKPPGEERLGKEDTQMPVIDYGNKVFSEDFDHGLCISMHQPYASLLVAGVKKHEGRVWATNHRGRLWIAAAAHQPDPDEVEALENFYKDYYNEPDLVFPKSYPTSCLLGCVYVDDCLDQETYRKQYPNGESNSPYVLICSNPIILPIFYPIVGQHKIYPLDKDLHHCAQMCLRYAKFVHDE